MPVYVLFLYGVEVSFEKVSSLCQCDIKSNLTAKEVPYQLVPTTGQTSSDDSAKSWVLGLFSLQTLLMAINNKSRGDSEPFLQQRKRKIDFLQVEEQHEMLQK